MNMLSILLVLTGILFPMSPNHHEHSSEIFYADTAKVGDIYAGMRLTFIDYNLETNDVTAQFKGETTLTGTFERFSEDNEFFSGISFSIDPASNKNLPLLASEEREARGFIFTNENQDELLAMLGNPGYGSSGRATVVIKDYRLNHQHKEITDTAILVKVISID